MEDRKRLTAFDYVSDQNIGRIRMKRLKQLLIVSSLLFLTACVVENDNEAEIESSVPTEDIESDEKWEDAVSDIDFSQNDLEEIQWEEIRLSKAQFDDFLKEMLENPLELHENYKASDELEILAIDFDGEIIEYTITTVDLDDKDLMASQSMYIYMLDSFTRHFYLQSDYSEEGEQPIIIFYDEDRGVLKKMMILLK